MVITRKEITILIPTNRHRYLLKKVKLWLHRLLGKKLDGALWKPSSGFERPDFEKHEELT